MSYCVVCDSAPGDCAHHQQRYLDDITYQDNGAGGWKVPAHERERWDAVPTPIQRTETERPKELEVLFSELDGPIYLDPGIKARIQEVYDLNPVRVTRLTTWFLANATGGNVRNPAGILWKRLGEIEHSET